MSPFKEINVHISPEGAMEPTGNERWFLPGEQRTIGNYTLKAIDHDHLVIDVRRGTGEIYVASAETPLSELRGERGDVIDTAWQEREVLKFEQLAVGPGNSDEALVYKWEELPEVAHVQRKWLFRKFPISMRLIRSFRQWKHAYITNGKTPRWEVGRELVTAVPTIGAAAVATITLTAESITTFVPVYVAQLLSGEGSRDSIIKKHNITPTQLP